MSISYWQRFGIHLTAVVDGAWRAREAEHSVQWRHRCWCPSAGSELGYRKGESLSSGASAPEVLPEAGVETRGT